VQAVGSGLCGQRLRARDESALEVAPPDRRPTAFTTMRYTNRQPLPLPSSVYQTSQPSYDGSKYQIVASSASLCTCVVSRWPKTKAVKLLTLSKLTDFQNPITDKFSSILQ